MHKYFVVVPIDRRMENIVLVCKNIFASVTVKKLGLNNNLSTDTYKKISNLSTNDIIYANEANQQYRLLLLCR